MFVPTWRACLPHIVLSRGSRDLLIRKLNRLIILNFTDLHGNLWAGLGRGEWVAVRYNHSACPKTPLGFQPTPPGSSPGHPGKAPRHNESN